MPQDALPDADLFKQMKRKIRKALIGALNAAALWVYYPDADILIQIRGGKCARLELREIGDAAT